MTPKKLVPFPIRCLTLALSVVLLLTILPLPTAHAAQLIIGSDLQESGGSVKMYIAIMCGSTPEPTVYKFTLQQNVNGTWKDYVTYGGVMNSAYENFTYYENPPRGYAYRIKITASSTSMSGIEQYSQLLNY